MSDATSDSNVEEIELDKGVTGLGFNIRGGIDNHHVENDPGIFVTTVRVDGAAAKDGRLAPGDKILEIDGFDLRQVTHATAVKKFHETSSKVLLKVERGAEQRVSKKAEDERKSVNATDVKLIPSNPSTTVNVSILFVCLFIVICRALGAQFTGKIY